MKISGIYITDKSIRLVQAVKIRRGRPVIKEEKTDIASLKDKNITSGYIVLGIPRSQVSIKYLTFPSVNDIEIKRMVEFEMNNLFPYKTEELIYDHAIIARKAGNYSQLMLAVAPRELILKQLSVLKEAGVSPDAVNISTVSLFNQLLAQNRPPANYLLVNFDDGLMEMIFVSSGKLAFSHGISFDAPSGTKGMIDEVISTVTILRDKGNSIDKIILGGKGADKEDFASALKQELPLSIEIDNSLDVLKGLASGGNGKNLKINLLPEEFKIHKRKSGRRRSVYIFSALLVLNLSLIANIVFFAAKARQEYLSLLKSEIQKILPQATVLQDRMLDLQITKTNINSGRLALGLLTDLYRASPDGINLSALDIQSQKTPRSMVIAGQAKSAEIVYKFADALRKSALIKKTDVSFVSKTNPGPGDQMVNFEIKSFF